MKIDHNHVTWWVAKCKCGWIDMSDKLAGGMPQGDTGDMDDVRCPACDSTDIEEAQPGDGDPALMTLKEYTRYRKALFKASLRGCGLAQAGRLVDSFTRADIPGDQRRALWCALTNLKPVRAAAVKRHKLPVPVTHKRQGAFLVPRATH